MKKVLLLLLVLYMFNLVNNSYKKYIYQKSKILSYLKNIKNNIHKKRNLETIILNKEDLYDNSTEEINDIETDIIIEPEIDEFPIDSTFEKRIYNTYSLLLIGFGGYLRIGKHISWFIYFRVDTRILSKKLFFSVNVYYDYLAGLQISQEKKVICELNNNYISKIIRYNCSLFLDEEDKNLGIQKIEGEYNSFLFENYSDTVILSPISNKTINNIQNEINDPYIKFIGEYKNLYYLENGKLTLDEINKKFYLVGAKLTCQNKLLNNFTKQKEENIEGNYIFPFKDYLTSNNEINIPCNIKINFDYTYNLKCISDNPIITNLNQAIGYGIDDDNKNEFILFNVTNDLIKFIDTNNENNQKDPKEDRSGLFQWNRANITLVTIILLFVILLLFLILKKKNNKKNYNESIESLNIIKNEM